ncbi:MAG: methionine biosynthesis protein MetW [bacterium]
MNPYQAAKPDHKIIASLIPQGATVLDLGCGDGSLLASLIDEKQVKGMGIDIIDQDLNKAMSKGLSVLQLDLNKGLSSFKNKMFDYVVLNMSLQSVYNTLLLVQEMVRVGKKAIVGFPNFGHYKLLLSLLSAGRMPKTKTLPFEWYNTPNIRLMTIKDFRMMCDNNGIKRLKEVFLDESGKQIAGSFLKWRAVEGIFLLQGGR